MRRAALRPSVDLTFGASVPFFTSGNRAPSRSTPRATINDVAERLKVEPHTITGAVSRAEAAGLVVREQCTEDGRRRWIRLTPEGERRLEQVVTALQAQREELVAAIEAVADNVREIPSLTTTPNGGKY